VQSITYRIYETSLATNANNLRGMHSSKFGLLWIF